MPNVIVGFLAGLISLVGGIFSATPAYGVAVFQTLQGGTGSSSPSGILYGDNGATTHLNTVTIGSNLTFSGGTLSATGGGSGTGNVATSTTETQGFLSYWTSTGATPATLGKVATGTISGSTGLSVTAGQSIIGSGLTITNTGVTSNVAGAGIAVSGSTGAVTITNTIGYPFLLNATSTTISFGGGLVSNGSTTIAGLSTGLVGNNNGLLYSFASSSLFGYTPLNPTRNITINGTANQVTSSAGTQDLSADRTWTLSLPQALQFPLSFTSTYGTTTFASSTALTAVNLTSTNATSTNLSLTGAAANCNGTNALTTNSTGVVTCSAEPQGTVTSVTGTYPIISSGGATPAISSALSTTTNNNWSGGNVFQNASTTFVGNSTTTGTNFAGIASSTNLFGAGLATCNSGNVLTWAAGVFGCVADQTSVGGANPFIWSVNYGVINAATTSNPIWAQLGINASSTSHFVYSSTTLATIDYASTTAITATTASTTNLIVGTIGKFTGCTGVNAPCITNGTNNTTGIYFPAANVFGLSVSGVQVLQANSSGITIPLLNNGSLVKSDTNGLLSNAIENVDYVNPTHAFDFTPTTNYAVNTSATSTPLWARLGLFASSTSNFDQVNIGSSTSSTMATSTDFGNLLTKGTASSTALIVSNSPNGPLSTDSNGNVSASTTGVVTAGTGISLTSSVRQIFGGSLAISNSGVISGLCTGGTTCSGTNPLAINSFSYPFTLGTNYGVANSMSTGTLIAFTAGIAASSTSYFNTINALTSSTTEASTTDISARTLAVGGASTSTIDANGLIRAKNLTLFSITGTAANCLSADTNGVVSGTGSACSTGGGSGIGDPFTHNANFGTTLASATTTNIWFKGNIFASSTAYMTDAAFASSTGGQILLSDTAGVSFVQRAIAGNLFIATSTGLNPATTTMSSVFAISQSGSACLGIGCVGTTSQGTLSLYDQSGNGPMLYLGGNVGGDTDWILRRFSNNDSTNNDRLALINVNNTPTTEILSLLPGGQIGIGTTTPAWPLEIATSTTPQLTLSDGSATSNHWSFRNINGNFYIATSSPTTFATSTNSVLSIIPNATSNATTTFSLTDWVLKQTSQVALSIFDAFNTEVLRVNTASTTGSIFTVAATTSPSLSSPIKLFDEDQYGHLTASSTGATPTVSCTPSGGTIGANSNDATGDFTTGTLSTACTLTFAHAYATIPEVMVGGGLTSGLTRSTTAVTFTLSAAVTGDNISYFIIQP